MTYGPQWEYKDTEYNLSLYVRDPDNEVRQKVDQIISEATVFDGGTP